MLVDKLSMAVPAQQYAEIVERSDNTGQFYSVHEKYRQRYLLLADCIEKLVLQILGAFGHVLSVGHAINELVALWFRCNVTMVKILVIFSMGKKIAPFFLFPF